MISLKAEPISTYTLSRDLHIKLYDWWDSRFNEFTKDDLKDGDIVTLRNGDKLMYVDGRFTDLLDYELVTNSLEYQNELTDDLRYSTSYMANPKENDIMKVERPVDYKTVFVRTEEEETIKEYTIEELEEKLGHKIKIKGEDL